MFSFLNRHMFSQMTAALLGILLSITPSDSGLTWWEMPSHESAHSTQTISVVPGAEVFEESTEAEELCGIEALRALSEKQQAVFAEALKDIPCALVEQLSDVRILEDPDMPRALSNGSKLYLRSNLFELPEAKEVIIHELGHVIDLGGLKSTEYEIESAFQDGHYPIYADDYSMIFYSTSWSSSEDWREDTKTTDFVSGYAATDPFEDFAESFLLYVEHGATFRVLAADNAQLQAKYNFFQDYIFAGEEFGLGEEAEDLGNGIWDVTKL